MCQRAVPVCHLGWAVPGSSEPRSWSSALQEAEIADCHMRAGAGTPNQVSFRLNFEIFPDVCKIFFIGNI